MFIPNISPKIMVVFTLIFVALLECFAKYQVDSSEINLNISTVLTVPNNEFYSESNYKSLKSPRRLLQKSKFEKCNHYEEWYSCLPKCPLFCYNVGKDCIYEQYPCQSGCDCKFGYAKTSLNGPCIPFNQCPALYSDDISFCSSNEEWLNGNDAPHCEETCNNYQSECRSHHYSRSSIGRCYCKQGYVRNTETGRCILLRDCPEFNQRCSDNEMYQSCGDPSEELCDDNWRDTRLFSSRSCIPGCFCRRGYSRINGYCQRSSECPVRCDRREIQIGNRCFCRNGFERVQGECICPRGQIEVNGYCENILQCIQGAPILTPPNCISNCRQSCLCNTGFVLSYGKCVCPNGQIIVNGYCVNNLYCGEFGTAVFSPPGCVSNCQQYCVCYPTFELISGICKCPNDKIVINGRCENLITCPNGSPPILIPPGCTTNCQQSCECISPYVFIGGVCTCPSGQIAINGGCENVIICDHGTPIIQPAGCQTNCRQICRCDPGYILINGVCVPIITCVDGTPIRQPENCVDNCVSQSCKCFEGFVDVGSGVCVCNFYSVNLPYGCMLSDCNAKICIDCVNSNERFLDPPIPVENDCAGVAIPTTEGKYCFCDENYCRDTNDQCISPIG